MKTNHPYTEFENTQLWRVVEESITDLVQNQDIEITAKKEYIIGSICQRLSDFYASDEEKWL